MTRLVDLPDAEFRASRATARARAAHRDRPAAHHRRARGKMVLVNPASCLTVLGGMYPKPRSRCRGSTSRSRRRRPSACGVAAGLRATGRAGEMTVLAMAGDGGTADIGIQALSGAAERNEDMIYVCYDNEAYMNTGTQRSGSTPAGRAHDHHVGRQAREPQGRAGDHGGAQHPLRRIDLGGLPRRPLRQGREGAHASTACATST